MLLISMTRSLIKLDNTVDVYYTRGKLIPIAITILVILI